MMKDKTFSLTKEQRKYLERVQSNMESEHYYSGTITRVLNNDVYNETDKWYLNHLRNEWPLK